MILLVLTEAELIFFIVASMVLGSGLVIKTILIAHWCFSCHWILTIQVLCVIYRYLYSAYTSGPSLFIMLHCQWVGWGYVRNWRRTQLRSLSQTVQRDVPYHMISCSAIKAKESFPGDWLGISQLLEKDCFCITFFSLGSFFFFFFSFNPFPIKLSLSQS